MSRQAYLFAAIALTGMTVGCCHVPCPPDQGACPACSCDNGPCTRNGWRCADGNRCSTNACASRQTCDCGCLPNKSTVCSIGVAPQNQPQSSPATINADKASDFAADQLNRPVATPTSRPKTLPGSPMDAVQNPLPPLVPPPAKIELPPVPPPPTPSQKTTANKIAPPLPNAASGKATSPYSPVRYN